MTPAQVRQQRVAAELKALSDKPQRQFHALSIQAAQSMAQGWWANLNPPTMGSPMNMSPDRWLGASLFQDAIKGGPAVLACLVRGNLIVEGPSLTSALGDLGLRTLRVEERGNKNGLALLGTDTTWVQLETYGKGKKASVEVVTVEDELSHQILQILEKVIVHDDPAKGLVFALTQGMNGYTLSHLGMAGTTFERGNYTPEVLEGYDHVVSDLRTGSPCGRLIILAGTPGTGKTFLVRALLTEVPKAAFVLIPPQIISDLGAPEILPALINAKNEIDGPLILILEDGDKALVERKDGDMSTISSLLNLGDGIMGSVLDIRVLVSTNAEKLKMDPATRREGRLCTYLSVESLSAEQANAVVERLTGKPFSEFDTEATLAKAYKQARKLGWQPAEVVPAAPALRPELLG